MNPNKTLREKGDFTRIAGTMREWGESLVANVTFTSQNRSPRPGATTIPATFL